MTLPHIAANPPCPCRSTSGGPSPPSSNEVDTPARSSWRSVTGRSFKSRSRISASLNSTGCVGAVLLERRLIPATIAESAAAPPTSRRMPRSLDRPARRPRFVVLVCALLLFPM
jgi:hypothetical protein